MTKFVIDAGQTCHTSYCTSVGPEPKAYLASMPIVVDGKPALVAPKDYIEMAAHLARPDTSGATGTGFARHAGPAIVKPCPVCLPSDQ